MNAALKVPHVFVIESVQLMFSIHIFFFQFFFYSNLSRESSNYHKNVKFFSYLLR